ncbi:phosphoadenosine phosphosulfate reductase family protein [uncultured Clostridium sp.]|uniref:phosphoadenosine phosphosulfate reductase domain-containing protein n=1 Tax=uncultured Clostridium sp. TaxID=59620 RepID=UPI0025E63FCE|nr:phosphoadenosine phosphosulfate reductase family protein [uncultured Clostridium sp.]
MEHIIFYSGGIGSYFTAKRVIDKYGKEDVKLLFTDTLIEDQDLYRFIKETSEKLGAELIWIKDGKDPWDVAFEKRFLPNSRVAQCSHVLKQKTAEKYIKENFTPEECILYLGIDWTENHRKNAPIKHWAPYKVEFPMCEEPFMDKKQMLEELEIKDGVRIPELYKLGFSHNNCGGFCFRAGIGHFKNLLEKKPELYKYHENKEQELRGFLLRDDISILRRSRNGIKVNITLKELREEIEQSPNQLSFDDLMDIGGCGCFIDDSIDIDEGK